MWRKGDTERYTHIGAYWRIYARHCCSSGSLETGNGESKIPFYAKDGWLTSETHLTSQNNSISSISPGLKFGKVVKLGAKHVRSAACL